MKRKPWVEARIFLVTPIIEAHSSKLSAKVTSPELLLIISEARLPNLL